MSFYSTHQKSPDVCPFGDRYQSYWDRRYDLFSRFDEGIQLDVEGLYSVKPEVLALDSASKIKGQRVFDAFCGLGGVSIALARIGKRVLTTEINPTRLEMAKNNARVYGVETQIEFHLGDAADFMTDTTWDAIYLDPPWGGVDYKKIDAFRLAHFSSSAQSVIKQALCHKNELIFDVPSNFDFSELDSVARPYVKYPAHLWNRLVFYTLHFVSLS